MKARNLILVGAATALFLAGGLLAPTDPSYPDSSNVQTVDRAAESIPLFEARAALDPNAVDLTLVAQLYERDSRETGDLRSLQRAEEAASRAIGLNPEYAPAQLALASAYFSQHRFSEASAVAQEANRLDPKLGGLALQADVMVATGSYEAAADLYERAEAYAASPGLQARLAYLEELHGEVDQALLHMKLAAVADLGAGSGGEQAAWYQVRLGDLEFVRGDLAEADRRYQAALVIFPNYYIALAARGKVAAAKGTVSAAISFYEQAIAVIPRPEFLAAVGDLYTRNGDDERAADSFATVEAIASLSDGVYDRALSLFFSDHGRPAEALDLAEDGLATRHDIYAFDAKAWALYRSGRHQEACQVIEPALALGSVDPVLRYHAGAIFLACDQVDRGRAELQTALERNPEFHPVFAGEAKALLQGTDW
ncbi:MAG TPA: tetratricopeptide repeat protein [Acidimicrobiia bacterium]